MQTMDLPEDLATVDGIDVERLESLVRILRVRAGMLAPGPAEIEAAVARCRPKSHPVGMTDFAIITTDPPAPPDEGSSDSIQRSRSASGAGSAASVVSTSSVGAAPEEASSVAPAADEDEEGSVDVVIPVDRGGSAAEPSAPELASAETIPAAGHRPPVEEQVAGADTQPESPRSVEQAKARLKRKKVRRIRPGTVIKGYEIGELLGAGGMGQVYRATQLSLHREVAFKVLSPRFAANPSFRKRFLREARSAGRFHHRNLISVHDVDEYDGLLFFSMDLVDGRSVGDLIDDDGALDEVWSLEVARQSLEALEYAHSRGVIHRDIKPDNIMIGADDAVKIADLGLSRIEDPGNDIDESNVTLTGTMMGTPYYMSPEQSEDAHAADARSDIYSLGATLYHMICGQVPYDGDSPVSVVVNATTLPLRFPREHMPSAPVRRLIARMMAKEPAQRPPTARACLQELERAMARRSSPLRFLFHPVGIAVMVTVVLLLLLSLAGRIAEHNRQVTYARFRQQVEFDINDEAFAVADRAIDVQLVRMPEYADRLERLRGELYEHWDEWALEQTAEVFERVEDELVENDFDAVIRLLRGIEQDDRLCSPAVVDKIDGKRTEARDLRHGAVWGDHAAAEAVPRGDLLNGLVVRGAEPVRVDDNRYLFTGNGRTQSLLVQSALRRGRWKVTLKTGDRSAFTWGFTLERGPRGGLPWCFVGARGGVLEVAVSRRRPETLGSVPANDLVSFTFEFTIDELILRHRDKQVRVPLRGDMPLALRWSGIDDAVEVAFDPPDSWYE